MNKLRSQARGFTLVELMIVVAIIGILASVAVPAFMKYIRRSKTTEATMNIRKMFDSTLTYWQSELADASGNILNKQFPANAAWSPPQGACAAQTGNKCAPATYNWSANATWQALNFGIDDPYYFSYQTAGAGGTGSPGAVYNLEASADLNVNGVFSLYRRSVTVQTDYSLSGGSGIYTQSDIE